jgi:glycosyltransferase involved in cell wall biosynthesis
MTQSVGIVFGTYNRLALLRRAIASVRAAIGDLPYEIIVVDGGSTDGSRQWMKAHRDITVIEQEGPLTGAVSAFNLGFGHAVDVGHDFVMHLNDDAAIVTTSEEFPIPSAVHAMMVDAKIGEVAFELDLRGAWGYEFINGVPYANFGVIRREAGIAVDKAQGDPTGRAWWNPIYRTYGADTEFGVWMWKLGYRILVSPTPGMPGGLRVHDANAVDALRAANHQPNGKSADSELFWSRWRNEQLEHLARAHTTPTRPPKISSPRRVRRSGRPGETPRRHR